MRILLLFNLARELRKGVDTDLACEREIEIIVPLVEDILRTAGHDVVRREADLSLWEYLLKNREWFDLVFNLAEGFGGANTDEPLVPTMLEALQIPFTGASSANMYLTLDKEKSKLVLKAYGIPVPDYQIIRYLDVPVDRHIKFPIIVKPIREEASVGIYYDNVVSDDIALARKCAHVISTYRQPAILEPFIFGREISIGIIGNAPTLDVLPALEFVFPDGQERIRAFRSYEYKWGGGKEGMIRAELSAELETMISEHAKTAFIATECRDYARMDFRLDDTGAPHLLEVNYNPGIGPNTHGLNNTLTMMASFAGLEFPDLIRRIVTLAHERSVHCSPYAS